MTAFVSLLRAINVGGRNLLKMDQLKEVHTALGLSNVLPYRQTGNVIFTSDETDSALLRKRIEESIKERCAADVTVIIRTAAELQEILDKHPFQQQEREPKWIAIMFLAEAPNAQAQDTLLQSYQGPEEIVISGREMYIYYPEGIGRSKLTHNLIEKKLKTQGTGRNLNTLQQLQNLLSRL